MRKIGNFLEKAIINCCKKHNFLQHRIITDWIHIAGSTLYKLSIPVQLKFPYNKSTEGSLYIAVSNPCHILTLQMSEKSIISKINVYFGYDAISSLKFIVKEGNHRQANGYMG